MKPGYRWLVLSLIITGFAVHGIFLKNQKTNFQILQHYDQLAWPPVGQAAIGTSKDGVLASSSAHETLAPIASMAKLITALAIMEKQPFKPGQPGLTYTIDRNDLARLKSYTSEGASALPIIIGMNINQYQAMQRMLIASDNTMADLLAERIFGSMDNYLLYASEMLKQMGLSKTHVADASGFNSATMSTPSELIAIGIAALKNPVIASIVSQQQAELPVAGNIKNTNQILGMDGIIGIKTGTTDQAGACLLFAAHYMAKNGKKGTILGVVMGDSNHRDLYIHCRALLRSAKQIYGSNGADKTPKNHASSQGNRLSKPPKI